MIIPLNLKLENERIYLRRVKISDATDEYVRWLNDKEINQYLEIRFRAADLDSLKDHIKKVSEDPNILFLAIIRKDNNCHIGNIKIGPIDWRHGIGDIGIMIGDRNSWGRGYATEAIKLLADYSLNTLKLHKLVAGIYADNTGSIKTFLKAGFQEDGIQKRHYRYKDGYIDSILMAKFTSP